MADSQDTQAIRPEGRVYVLRVWHDGDASPAHWRATLREGTHGEKQHFASIDDCIEHLYGELSRR